MLNKIKNNLEENLRHFMPALNKRYALHAISPLLFDSIQEFVARPGKRLRPTLCILGYLGFARKQAPHLYTSALSLELLHDYMLVHDDIIDKSDLRRGKPSMHNQLNSYLGNFRGVKFNGQDLALIVGDVMYALALQAFLTIQVAYARKERAFKKLIEAAFYTGSGEFIELLCGTKGIGQITKDDIYKIYDLKTAFYSFAAPLSIGALLAGANDKEAQKLSSFGIYSGRAFQIKDDILGMFSEEKEIGKSMLTDLKEAKKTLLVWYAYAHTHARNKTAIRRMLGARDASGSDLRAMRRIVTESGALAFARKEIDTLLARSKKTLASCAMRASYKKLLLDYTRSILDA